MINAVSCGGVVIYRGKILLLYKNYKRTMMTEEGIKRFEEDVALGNSIDVENYLAEEKDYSNNISKTSVMLSNNISSCLRRGIVKMFELITKNIE